MIKSVFFSFGLKVLNFFLGLALSVVLARYLGPNQYGVYAFALSLVGMLGLPVQIGLPTLILREVARYHTLDGLSKIKGLISISNRVVIYISLVVIALVFVMHGWFFQGRGSYELKHETILVAVILIPLVALSRVREAWLQGMGFVLIAQLADKIALPIVMISLVLLVNTFVVVTAPIAMASYLGALTVSFLLSYFFVKRYLYPAIKIVPVEYELAKWIKSIIPLSFLAGVNFINTQVDILMLGVFSSSSEVALYKVATSGAVLMIFAMVALESVISPKIVEMYTSKKITSLQRMLTLSARFSGVFAVFCFLFFMLFGRDLIHLVYGNSYKDSYSVLVILALAQIVNASVGSVHAVLNLTGHEKYTLRAGLLAALINITLNILLIPKYGAIGAAIAMATSIIFINILLAVILWRLTGLWSFIVGSRVMSRAC